MIIKSLFTTTKCEKKGNAKSLVEKSQPCDLDARVA